jgi:hypothetical protein
MDTIAILQLTNMCTVWQATPCMILFLLSTKIAIDRFIFFVMDLYTHILELISEDRLIGITKLSVFFSAHICHHILLLTQGMVLPLPFLSLGE